MQKLYSLCLLTELKTFCYDNYVKAFYETMWIERSRHCGSEFPTQFP